MGIVNVTPDSFYAGSRATAGAAVAVGLELEQEGADYLDIGGESTRPGADPVSEDEESRRVLPVVEALAKRARIPISVDTCKAAVARRAREAGASILNDITALRGDPRMIETAKAFDHVILMHMQGTPRTMQESPSYQDVVVDIRAFFEERLAAFSRAGGEAARVWLDPGIGFGKTLDHNLEILRRLERFAALGRPLVVGASRKSFLGKLLGGKENILPPAATAGMAVATGGEEHVLPPEDRLEGSLAVACRAAEAGAAVVRVHDVRATCRALDTFAAVRP